jgi:hypothetical protein
LRPAWICEAGGVEPALVLAALLNGPVRIDQRAIWFPGATAPLVLPATALPAQPRALRILTETRLDLGERVAAALAWGAAEPALRAAQGHSGPLAADHILDEALRRWAAGESSRLGLPPDAVVCAIGSDGKPRPSSAEERGALADVQELLAPLAWPRWRGPLLLVPYGVDHPAIAPGAARVVRPALPVLRLPPGGRSGLAVAIAELALSLAAAPEVGWPAWLVSGVAGCARARADGSGIPERALAERRAAAGSAAISGLFDGSRDDPELAMAVMGGLLHPSRRARLPDLLELLRHGTGSAGAVGTAYRLSPAQLAGEPAGASRPR